MSKPKDKQPPIVDPTEAIKSTFVAPTGGEPAPQPGGGQSPPPEGFTILTMSIDDLQIRVDKARDLAQQIRALLPGGYVLTAVERAQTNGHVRTGEEAIWLQTLLIAAKYPQFFESLADMDEGEDPTKLEVGLMQDRVRRAQILGPLAAELMDMSKPNTSDTALHLRSLVRSPVREIYAIAKAQGKTHPGIKNMLAPILDYYRKMAKSAQEAKKQKDAESAAAAEALAKQIAAEEAAKAKEAADAAAAKAAADAAAVKGGKAGKG